MWPRPSSRSRSIAWRGLPVRLEPRHRADRRHDGNREGGSSSALSQPHDVRARLSAREPGDGLRRTRSGLRLLQGCLPARHLRQHEDGGRDDLRRQGAAATIAASCRCARTTSSSRSPVHAGVGLGERVRSRTRVGSRPRALLHPAIAREELRRAERPAARSLRRLRQSASSPRADPTAPCGRCSRPNGRTSCATPAGSTASMRCRRRSRRPASFASDNNKYSVSASAVGRPVEIQAYADRVVIRQDGRIVAEHPRAFGRGATICDPWHYVPVLARKPGALRNGAPFKDWVLPQAIDRIRRKLAGSDDGDRQMAKILAMVLSDGLPAVESACAEGADRGRLVRRRHHQHPLATARSRAAHHHHDAGRADPPPCADCRLCPLRQPQKDLTPLERNLERHLERTDILDMMGSLKLFGMRSAFDEIVTTAVKAPARAPAPRRGPAEGRDRREAGALHQIPDDDSQAAARQGHRRLHLRRHAGQRDARARPRQRPLHRRAAQLRPRRAAPVRARRTSPSRSPAAASGRDRVVASSTLSTSSTGSRPRPRAGRQGRLADYLTRMDFVVLDELGYLPFRAIGRPAAVPPDQPPLRADLGHRHHQPRLRRMADRLRRRQDDHGAARSPHPPLRHRRDRQRELALQEPRLKRAGDRARPGSATRPAHAGASATEAPVQAAKRGVKVGRRSGVKFEGRLTLVRFREAMSGRSTQAEETVHCWKVRNESVGRTAGRGGDIGQHAAISLFGDGTVGGCRLFA